MHTRTTTTALLLAAGLALTACSNSSDSAPATPSTAPAHDPARTTAATAYDPVTWKARLYTLIRTQLDPARADCTASPSSDTCANALRQADTTILAMNQAITDSGTATRYPATVDHIQRNILTGYNKYVADGCPGNQMADEYNSDCRGDMLLVLLGVATLPSKMTLDGAS